MTRNAKWKDLSGGGRDGDACRVIFLSITAMTGLVKSSVGCAWCNLDMRMSAFPSTPMISSITYSNSSGEGGAGRAASVRFAKCGEGAVL